jgi:hypothetical protein
MFRLCVSINPGSISLNSVLRPLIFVIWMEAVGRGWKSGLNLSHFYRSCNSRWVHLILEILMIARDLGIEQGAVGLVLQIWNRASGSISGQVWIFYQKPKNTILQPLR